MKKSFSIIFLCILLLVGCSPESSYTEEKALENDDIVIRNLTSSMQGIIPGQQKVHNLEQLNQFQRKAEAGEATELTISIFDVDSNNGVVNQLSYENQLYLFQNHYNKYGQATGDYTCKGPITMEIVTVVKGCELDGKQTDDVVLFLASVSSVREAKAKAKK
ncbi:hypothetical protein WAK64_08180 [Bacillus spongiae]|uniref:DUF4362 domain-containing protein n=1 Tax=Bacillus spongiae TaxID=2683610 RepID=A0ABU8HCZ4_9BACI